MHALSDELLMSSPITRPPQSSIYGIPPASNRPGAFPREYVAQGETVIFESRPSLAAFIRVGRIIGVVIGAILFSLYVYGVTTAINSDTLTTAATKSSDIATFYGSIAFSIPLFILVGLPLIAWGLGFLFGILRWRNTAFAITDRRAMRSSGVFSRNTNDCAHDKIQSVILRQGLFQRILGYGNIVYLTSTAPGFRIREKSVHNSGGVFWTGVKDPVNTRRYVQEVEDKAREQMKIKEFQSMAAVLRQQGATIAPGATISPGTTPMQALTPTVVTASSGKFCRSCGAPIDMNSKFCKSCGAQVLVEA
jgi:hypothetical protein